MSNTSDNSQELSELVAERLEALRAYVSKQNLKLTRQRELIAEVFFRSGGHLSAEDLLEEVRKDDPHVSLATIYRTMKLLTDCNLASAHRFGESHTVYEPQESDDEHHDHIICQDCDKILEFYDARIERLQDEIVKSQGFVLADHRMELYVRCQRENCANKTS